MHFIHAVGQSEGFYGSDQLKYHGKGQRWITVIGQFSAIPYIPYSGKRRKLVKKKRKSGKKTK